MLLRCCLIRITIIILKFTLYLVYLGPFLSLDLFVSYLWLWAYVSFIFSLIFVTIKHITSLKPVKVCCPRKGLTFIQCYIIKCFSENFKTVKLVMLGILRKHLLDYYRLIFWQKAPCLDV